MKLTMMMLSLTLAGTALAAENVLNDQEVANGWQLLFDGKTTANWRSLGSAEFPKVGWKVADGALTVEKGGKGGDIITATSYKNFELVFEFKLTEGANSGLKYFVKPAAKPTEKHGLGCEYQVLDDDKHPDAKLGRDGNRKTASLYDVIPAPATKKIKPVGEWNLGRIIVNGKHVEHWLNGVKTVEYDRGSEAFAAAVAKSKFAKQKDFGLASEGHILLQDHNDEVSYRNLKIKALE
ncbi:MAG: DUF1080 domain-containing protein [Kiritimatiellaeota bacterium]|nr:DUF1080 domain-containing protein [Kiritimatiellota bacterium]